MIERVERGAGLAEGVPRQAEIKRYSAIRK
jgi:hypothetical protein